MAPQQPERQGGPRTTGRGAAGAGGDAGAGGIRAAAAERSARRAAAVAVTEDFHLLRMRPYVGEPFDEPAGTTVRRPLAEDRDGPATTDLGLFPAPYRRDPRDTAAEPEPAGADSAVAVAAARGRHRRRRRGMVVVAAAVAASALAAGAVAVTGQVMGGDEQGGTDRALPDLTTSMPDVTLPSDAGPATATSAAPVAQQPRTDTLAATATPSAAPKSPSRSASPRAAAPTSAPASTGAATPAVPPAAPPATAPPAATTPPPAATPPPSAQPIAPASVQTLEVGDTGTAVADLQRRLSEVWVYHGPVDGVFDRQVQRAVATFQVWYWVSDAVDGAHDGVYGPQTRAVLERQSW